MTTEPVADFSQFGLPKPLLKALTELGYEKPSPIQSQTIEIMLAGRDVLGQAQTGTGKTAAFALPVLTQIDLKQKLPQCMVLAPTRELAIQVAEAFATYASHLKGFHVLPIYGGQDYRVQTRALERGVHVVVGTPGRTMDHMRRGTLKLENLTTLVLDEADEMLRMGFIDDVEWILEHTPKDRQIALFSATMPTQIRRIAERHLNKPATVTIKEKTATANTIRQRFCAVNNHHKMDALTRILEAESIDAMIVFVRTRNATVEIADKLNARGYAAAALNGDIQQKQRERTIAQLKSGKLDILVATDVAARGLDVERVSHVLNYDIPYDTEAYIHRIGRTGRAGRQGDAILFITPREKHLKNSIERATKTSIEVMSLPSNEMINNKRLSRFQDRITEALETQDLSTFVKIMEGYQAKSNYSAVEISAAMAHLLQGSSPFLFPEQKETSSTARKERPKRTKETTDKFANKRRPQPAERIKQSTPEDPGPVEKGMERFRLAVGYNHDVKPGNIVGAIANEAGIDSEYIGRIVIQDDYTLIDLPEGMPKEIYKDLQKTRVCGQMIRISRENSKTADSNSEKKPHKKKSGPGHSTDKTKANKTTQKKSRKKSAETKKTEAKSSRKKDRKRDQKNKGKPKSKSGRKSPKAAVIAEKKRTKRSNTKKSESEPA